MMAGSIFLYTLRVRNRGGAPAGGWRKFRRPPLHRTPAPSTLTLKTSSPEGASFGRKRNFSQISAPPLGKLEDPWTPVTSRRKLIIRVGKAAVKISAAHIYAFELLAIESIKKLKIPNFRQSPSTYAWQGRGALYAMLVRFYVSDLGPKIFPIIR